MKKKIVLALICSALAQTVSANETKPQSVTCANKMTYPSGELAHEERFELTRNADDTYSATAYEQRNSEEAPTTLSASGLRCRFGQDGSLFGCGAGSRSRPISAHSYRVTEETPDSTYKVYKVVLMVATAQLGKADQLDFSFDARPNSLECQVRY